MPRSTGGPTHARKRKRILRKASGMRGMSGHNYRPALEFTRKADMFGAGLVAIFAFLVLLGLPIRVLLRPITWPVRLAARGLGLRRPAKVA